MTFKKVTNNPKVLINTLTNLSLFIDISINPGKLQIQRNSMSISQQALSHHQVIYRFTTYIEGKRVVNSRFPNVSHYKV